MRHVARSALLCLVLAGLTVVMPKPERVHRDEVGSHYLTVWRD
jgi:hypothetical protein